MYGGKTHMQEPMTSIGEQVKNSSQLKPQPKNDFDSKVQCDNLIKKQMNNLFENKKIFSCVKTKQCEIYKKSSKFIKEVIS